MTITRRRSEPSPGRAPARARYSAGLSLAACIAAFAPAGCADLPLLEEDICGNRVIEGNEACDGEPGCARVGVPHACQYLCEEQACPAGYGCGVDNVCRRHSGAFEPPDSMSTATTLDFMVGDVNGDRCHEIVLTTLQGTSVTASPSRVSSVCPASEQLVHAKMPGGPQTPPTPLLVDLLGDKDDLTGEKKVELMTAGSGPLGEGLFFHVADDGPTLATTLFPTVDVEPMNVRLSRLRAPGGDRLLLFLGVANAGMMEGMPPEPGMAPPVRVEAITSKNLSRKELEAALPGGLSDRDLVVAADIDDPTPGVDPCDEVMIALLDQPNVQIYRTCDQNGGVVFEPIPGPPVKLDGSARIRGRNASLSAVDYNDDGHVDLLMNATDKDLHIAYGVGDGTFQSKPPADGILADQTTSVLSPNPHPMLGEDRAFFVAGNFDDATKAPELAVLQCPEADPFSSPLCAPLAGACEAVVADIDFDGRDDVVATGPQEPGLIVLRSDPDGVLHLTINQTQCPPHNLVPGDFDGDGVTDIAFFDQAAPRSGEPVTTLRIVYGNALAHPSSPEGDARFVGAMALAGVHFSDSPDEQLASVGKTAPDDKSGGLALIGSESSRTLLAPFYLTVEPPGGMAPSKTLPLGAAASGQFAPKDGAEARTWLAVMTPGDPMKPGTQWLWLLEADESGSRLRAARQSAIELSACDKCVLTAFDADGDGGDEIMILGTSDIAVLGSDTGAFGEGAFTERARFTVDESFVTTRKTQGPMKYLPRPLVADLDGDGWEDVVARSERGALIALWGRPDGSAEKTVLFADGCDGAAECGPYSIALINADAHPGREIVVVGPRHLALYELAKGARELTPKGDPLEVPGPPMMTPMPMTSGDFSAVGAADIDGDGVDDLVVMHDSTFIDIRRGVQVPE